jgi:hypothetical protein
MAEGAACDNLVTSTSTSAMCTTTSVATGTCASGTTSCGGLGQACCVSSYSTSTSYYYCGGAGSRCLANSSSGTTQYLCTACGDKAQRCCIDSSGSAVGCKSPYRCSYDSTSGYYNCVDASTVPATNCTAALACCVEMIASDSTCQSILSSYSDSMCAEFVVDYCGT